MPHHTNVRLTPSGRQQARFRPTGGRLVSRTFDTASEAHAWLAEQQEAVRVGRWASPSAGATLFSERARTWLDQRVNVRASTLVRDETDLRRHVLSAFGPRALVSNEQPEICAWVKQLVDQGLAPATVHKCYQLLTAVMTSAVDARLITHHPCHNVPLPRIVQKEMRFLAPKQVRTQAESVPDRYRALVWLGCYAGLRIGELAGLNRRHLDLADLARARVTVEQIAIEVRGELHIGPPKTERSRRSIPLPPPVAAVLVRHLCEYVALEESAPV
ncbi:MAG TPA: hypothetical protein VLR26_13895, partial [Frankiaceae bacterium]|nr:hypothetical protein [Frankiaceae bacterium]